MSEEMILTNARIVLADSVLEGGTVRVSDGGILEIAEGRSNAAEAIDLEGDYLLPGLIELHTDNLEKHLAPRPGVRWPGVPALLAHDAQIAAAGITTVFDAVVLGNTIGNNTRLELLDQSVEAIDQARAAGLTRADHFLHLRCEVADPDVLNQYEKVQGHPLLRLVSLMDHTPGQRQFVDIAQYRLYYQKKHNVSEAELQEMIVSTKANQEKYADPHRIALAAACRDRGIPIAAHDDATMAHVAESASLGITISEFPTTVEAATGAHDNGMATIMGAPNVVRGGSHSGNVAAHELAELGLLDALSSDYVPISMMHAAFKLNQQHGLTLPQAVATVSRNPARMLKMDDRGEIAAGKRADLARVTLHQGLPLVRQVWREGSRVA
ncbi:alpha-D-ribose 1-methylphosphonate 5-triphosphate diphosphatase [Oceanibaculum pacificum]|uniref:Phosphonate metabolism protein PhnM n=1 Tax=Oceanibaculum pacificum TaxID=580166 RepID=A0A154W651_9PROT|nr:alpha-D-ribose 1-methylphosphonate 5-triphosphate diphosphatase [Oceanibaculum pacificum]KZD08979.1 phosphonate metabolism protein PhnM [Oceanibaculum pacificum]